MFSRFWEWNKFENWSIFEKVIRRTKSVSFLGPPCRPIGLYKKYSLTTTYTYREAMHLSFTDKCWKITHSTSFGSCSMFKDSILTLWTSVYMRGCRRQDRLQECVADVHFYISLMRHHYCRLRQNRRKIGTYIGIRYAYLSACKILTAFC